MSLEAIVAVSGKSGLFKVIGKNKAGFVVESLDDKRTKHVINHNITKIVTLEDVTVLGKKNDVKLTDIFLRMKKTSVVDIQKADNAQLRNYFATIAPEHDESKVYISDIKKIVTWFNVLNQLSLLNEEEATVKETAVAEKPKKAKATNTQTKQKKAKSTKS